MVPHHCRNVTGGQIVDSSEIDATYDDLNGTTSLVLKTTGVTAGSYGSATSIPVFTVDSKGRLVDASAVSISTTLNIAGNTGSDGIALASDTLTIDGSGPISTAVNSLTNTLTISAADATTSSKGVASFDANSFGVASGVVSIKAGGVSNTQLANSSLTIGTTTITLGASSTTLAGLSSVTSTSFTGALTGNASTATALQNARTIAISGPVTGTATSFDGTSNITIPVSALDVGHANVTGVLPVNKGGTGVTTSTGTGSIVLNNSPTFTGVPTAPTAALGTTTTQLATTEFVAAAVDAARSGLDVKSSVKAATTEDITLSGTQTIDGVILVSGDRVLVKDQIVGSQNGIYVVDAGAWSRSTDADISAEVTDGMFTFVEQGTVNADSGWVLTSNDPIILNTSSLVFVQFSGAGQITAGTGLTKTGNTLNVGAGTGITVNADDVALTGQALALHNLATNGLITRTASGVVTARLIAGVTDRTTITNADGVSGDPIVDIASTYAGQTSIVTLGTITSGTWNAATIGTTYGGTGLTNYSTGDILYASGTNTLAKLAAGASGKVLQMNGGGTPVWGDIDGGTY